MPDLRLGDEEYLHPNAIGFATATATLMAMHLAHKNKAWRWPAFWLALTLIRTISKTSIIAFFVAMLFYLFKDRALTRATRIKIAVAGAVILVSLSGLLIAYFNAYAESTNPETLTGRTIIWATSGEIALEKPIFGHGFYSFHYAVPLFGVFQAAHAHNELLQQFFTLGIVGVVLVVGLYWVFFQQIRRAPKSSIKTLAAELLVFALVRASPTPSATTSPTPSGSWPCSPSSWPPSPSTPSPSLPSPMPPRRRPRVTRLTQKSHTPPRTKFT